MEGRGELTLEALCTAMRGANRVRVVGSGERSQWLPDWQGETVVAPTGIIAHDAADQVVQVWAGTRVEDLQSQLSVHGQCLPLTAGVPATYSQNMGTIGGLVSTNLPHALVAQCGSVRDWVIGMTVVRTDGTVAKCGSKAVKNVAGYDVHKLFVGSRGTLGAIASVILRTFPHAALPASALEVKSEEQPRFIARTLRADFGRAVERAAGVTAVDTASCTFWATEEPELPTESWLIGMDGKMKRAQQPDKFETRARLLFDPTAKLAPGWKD